jgi:class 3 adenylate cyclase/CHASE2 domain-containing sensor protein
MGAGMARMNRIKRRRLVETSVLGITLTLLVLLADHFGLLHSLDDWAYDRRVRDCQWAAPPPSDQIVHLDVDDRALEVIGRWPWPRTRLAELLDEIQLAGPKVVGMDLLLSEAEEAPGESEAGDKSNFSPGDARLAATLKRMGNVVTTVIFYPHDPKASQALPQAARAEWAADLELSEAQLTDKLAMKGFGSASDREQIAATFIATRREAMFDRIKGALGSAPTTPDILSKQLLKSSIAELDSPLKRLLREQYDRAVSERELLRFGVPWSNGPSGAAVPVLDMAGVEGAPRPEFSRAAAAVGFVDWRFLESQVARDIPLFLEYDHRLYPQFALIVACRMLDVDPKDIRVEKDAVVIPRHGGDNIVIPVRTRRLAGRDVPMMMEIRFFGTPHWAMSYDWPRHQDSKQHLSMNFVWDALVMRRRIAENNAGLDDNIKFMLAHLEDEAGIKAYEAKALPLDDTEARVPLVRALLDRADTKGTLETAAGFKPEELDEKDRKFIALARVLLPLMLEQNAALKAQLAEKRAELAAHVKGKAVLIGWTAIGTSADFVPTSMHDVCPGIVVHGVIVNAILTNHFWYAAPNWVAPLITLIAGLLTAAAAARLSPWRAAAVAFFLAFGYFLVNGLLIFGRWNITLNVGGPVVVIAVVWGACALAQTLLEASERAHVERRFRSYVDPSLVEYVVEHAELAHMEGEIREITVCFTDLAGFTAISERLGTKTVPLLNEYWEAMIPIVRRHRGFVAKFMGDGLFFFFGAPAASATHAPDAIQTVLEMQDALKEFNERTAQRGLPALGMRAGINTGAAVVGDAGTRDASDYTALGDVTNLGSRLEGANKGFGTRNLLTQESADLCAGRFLLQPVGKLCVVGKTTGVFTYEAICPLAEATDAQRRHVELTRPVVDAFVAGQFADCLTAVEKLVEECGPTKLTALYRELGTKYLAGGAPEGFDGSIRLTEK